MFIPLKTENPIATFPFFTILLILINISVFIYQLLLGPSQGEEFIFKFGAIPYEITRIKDIPPEASIPVPLTMITAIFMHGGILHLIGNMWFLWLFGNNVEEFLGHFRFIFFYFISGIAASLLHVLFNFNSTIPMIGASGAIAGVMGAYMILFPNTRVRTLVFLIFFITVVPVPALLWLGVWFLYQVLSASSGGGVAWFAHIGGFIVGIYYAARIMKKRGYFRRNVVEFKRRKPPGKPPDWLH